MSYSQAGTPVIGHLADEEERMSAHIVADPSILGGKPCIKGTRISVEFILELFASGADHEDILREYPHLTMEGITEALRCATTFLSNSPALIVDLPLRGL